MYKVVQSCSCAPANCESSTLSIVVVRLGTMVSRPACHQCYYQGICWRQCHPCTYLPGAADVQQFSTLSRLTHLDLGCAGGVAALAGQLPRLQSLALCYPHPPATVSAMQEHHRRLVTFTKQSCYAANCIAVPASTQPLAWALNASCTYVVPLGYA